MLDAIWTCNQIAHDDDVVVMIGCSAHARFHAAFGGRAEHNHGFHSIGAQQAVDWGADEDVRSELLDFPVVWSHRQAVHEAPAPGARSV